MISLTKTPQALVPGARHGNGRSWTAYQCRTWACTRASPVGEGSRTRSDVALEDARLGHPGQALADGAGAALADALDRHEVLDVGREQALQ